MNCGIPLCANCVVDLNVKNNKTNEMNVIKLCQNCATELQNKEAPSDQQNDEDEGANSQNIQFSRRLSSIF